MKGLKYMKTKTKYGIRAGLIGLGGLALIALMDKEIDLKKINVPPRVRGIVWSFAGSALGVGAVGYYQSRVKRREFEQYGQDTRNNSA